MIRIASILIALVAAASLRADEALSREEVFALVEKLGTGDRVISEGAFKELVSLRSDEEIAHLVQANARYFSSRSDRLRTVFEALGERAVKEVFAASVDAKGTRTDRVPYASHILTNCLKPRAIPHLSHKLRTGSTDERRKAAWALWCILYYGGLGDNDPVALAAVLHAAAAGDESDYVRKFSLQALRDLRQPAAVPQLMELLGDKSSAIEACKGLGRLGKAAFEAIPRLEQGIRNRELPVEALRALVAIAGPEAVPFAVEHGHLPELDRFQRATVSNAFAGAPNPAAIPFMARELWDEEGSSRIDAGRFFAGLDHPASVAHLRRCLDVHYPEAERFEPTRADVRVVTDLRIIAILALGERGDVDSYPRFVKLLANDPSNRLRTAAAQVLGRAGYGGEGAVAALKACLRVEDRGGALHGAVVEALAAIGSDEALEVLYQGAVDGPVKRECLRFWVEAEERRVFERFLELSGKMALDEPSRSRVLWRQLLRHRGFYGIPLEEMERATRGFRAF